MNPEAGLKRPAPRLFDEVPGWLVTGERWVDRSRLRALLSRTRPLFVAESGAALPLVGELDPWFADAGVLRRTVIGAGASAGRRRCAP